MRPCTSVMRSPPYVLSVTSNMCPFARWPPPSPVAGWARREEPEQGAERMSRFILVATAFMVAVGALGALVR